MRRRLVVSTLLIALVCVIGLGVPLAVVARRQVTTSALQRLHQQAQIVAAGLEDRLSSRQPITAALLGRLLPEQRVLVTTAHGERVASGAPTRGEIVQTSLVVAGAKITVQESRGTITSRSRSVTLLVVGLGLLATMTAIALALRQAKRLAGPLSELADRADALGRGDFTQTRLRTGIPEIDEISDVLNRSAHQIGGLIELQRDFAADAAHQIRTPLTGVALRLEEVTYLSDGAIRTEAEAALAQVERLNHVITSLLARARGDSAQPTPVDLPSLVREESDTWKRVLAARGRDLELDLAPAAIVLARRSHLTTILTTLLDNALRHGAGTITIAVDLDAHDVRLRVRDEGKGIPVNLRERVFDRTVSGNRGTGIGLALARSLAEAEGASLDVVGPTSELVLTLAKPGRRP